MHVPLQDSHGLVLDTGRVHIALRWHNEGHNEGHIVGHINGQQTMKIRSTFRGAVRGLAMLSHDVHCFNFLQCAP